MNKTFMVQWSNGRESYEEKTQRREIFYSNDLCTYINVNAQSFQLRMPGKPDAKDDSVPTHPYSLQHIILETFTML